MKQAYAKIGLLHHVGGGNLGDDATLGVVMHNVKQRWANAAIACFSINPNDTRTRHELPTYPIRTQTWGFGFVQPRNEVTFTSTVKTVASRSRFAFRLLRALYALVVRLPRAFWHELSFLGSSRQVIKSFDFLIISGGGQLTEWGGPWGFPYTLFKWVLLAKSARVTCLFLNVGAGPLTHPLSKWFVTRALCAADYVSFRDIRSRKLAQKIGFTGDCRVFPDSVYNLEVPAADLGSLGKGCHLTVGVAPMPYCDPRTDPAEKNQDIHDDFIGKLAIFAAWLARESYSLELFGTDIGVDPLAIKDLQMALRDHHGVVTAQEASVNSIHDLLLTMSAMDYVVTCRFHGVVFAHLLNKPVLAIAHHPKVTNLMKDLGLSKYCVDDIRAFDGNVLIETFQSMVSNTAEIKSHMAATLANYKSQLITQFDGLFPPYKRLGE